VHTRLAIQEYRAQPVGNQLNLWLGQALRDSERSEYY
jgi:hypothetical protein